MNTEKYNYRSFSERTMNEHDLSDLNIFEVEFSNTTLMFDPPLVLKPQLSDDQKNLVVVHDETAMYLVAPSREQLLSEINEEIVIIWNAYAKVDDDNVLTTEAQEIKYWLLNNIKEVKK